LTRLILSLSLAVMMCGCGMNTKQNSASERRILQKPSVQLAARLSAQGPEYERDIARSLDDVAAFFREAGLELGAEKIIDSVIVFDRTSEARDYFAETSGVSPDEFPDTFSGTVVGRTLYLVSREQYRQHWDRLYSAWPWTDEEYHRLMVHELAHRAHETFAIRLFGSADAMGPTWFFEGLAIMCAGQFQGSEPLMTRAEVGALLSDEASTRASYPLYGRIVRSLAQQSALKDLILRATDPGFPASMWGK
jgi:hypothetical protein